MGNGWSRKIHTASNPMPKGYRRYSEAMLPWGMLSHKDNAIDFVESDNIWLELKEGSKNKYHTKTIEVRGCSKGWLKTHRRLIGYLPLRYAAAINITGLFDVIKPRLHKTFISSNDFVQIEYSLAGPKEHYKVFKEMLDMTTAEYKKFFKEMKKKKRRKNDDDEDDWDDED